jgi:hypothetical protein
MRALHRLRLEADAGEAREAAVVRGLGLRPERADRAQRVVGDRAAAMEVDADRSELGFGVAAAEPRDEAAAGQDVERRQRLREQHRVVVRQYEDAGSPGGCAT